MSTLFCPCENPSVVKGSMAWDCSTCRRPISDEKRKRLESKRVTLPPEKAEALREIHNLRREFNAKLDRLKADILKA